MRIACIVAGVVAALAPAARADQPQVDPSTLQPPPPEGAHCVPSGRLVLCRTVLDASTRADPVVDLPCGTVYETASNVRHGLRFYEDRLLVRRHGTSPLSGFWSLSPSADGPRLQIVGHLNWWTEFTVPGNEDSGLTTSHGLEVMLKSPTGGVVAKVAGRTLPDGSHTGIARVFDDPATVDVICAALEG